MILAFAAAAASQDAGGFGRKKPEVRIVAVRPEKAEVRVGEVFRVSIDVEIPKGWYIYPTHPTTTGTPTKFVFEGAEVAGKVQEPKAKTKPAEAGLEAYDYHEGAVTFTVPIYLKSGPAPGPHEVKGLVDYQICSAVCIPGQTRFSFPITVAEGEEKPPAGAQDFESRGVLGLILLGMTGGLISLVMPCTYPLIPITLTYFLKQAAGSRSHGMVLSGAYSLGIILSFTGLGFLLTVLLGAGGAREFAANPWVNVGVGLLFLWFTGSLFGWYEIRLPFGLESRLAGTPRQGVGGAFILGLLFSIVTFTCTIPIAATILTLAAQGQRLSALVAMLAYSSTMALPFFVMGVFPGLLREVPKGGGWLGTVKTSMAFVELGLAVFYLSKADQSWEIGMLNRWVVLALYVAVGVGVALYLLRFFRARPGFLRLVSAGAFLALGGVMAYGFTGKRLGLLETIVPPPPIHGTTLPAGLAEAKRLGKPLFVEFTGVT
jgi:thiol:disulfide interchange protein DsbD